MFGQKHDLNGTVASKTPAWLQWINFMNEFCLDRVIASTVSFVSGLPQRVKGTDCNNCNSHCGRPAESAILISTLVSNACAASRPSKYLSLGTLRTNEMKGRNFSTGALTTRDKHEAAVIWAQAFSTVRNQHQAEDNSHQSIAVSPSIVNDL